MEQGLLLSCSCTCYYDRRMFDPCATPVLQGESTGDAGPGGHRVNAFVRNELRRLRREGHHLGAGKAAPSRKRFCSQGVTAFGPRRRDLGAGKPAASRKRFCSQGVAAFTTRTAALAAGKPAASRKRFCSQGVAAFTARTAALAAGKPAASRKRFCSQGVAAFTARTAALACRKTSRVRVNAFVRKELRRLRRERQR